MLPGAARLVGLETLGTFHERRGDQDLLVGPGAFPAMWGRAFGRGILEPFNDFSDDEIKRASQPEVLAYLTKEMRRVNYDLREFMRILYNTRAYQSVATAEEPDLTKTYYFQGPVLRRMRAEQAWDSMMVLAHGASIDTKKGGDGSFYKKILDIDFKDSCAPGEFRCAVWDPKYLDPAQLRTLGFNTAPEVFLV